MLFYRSEISHEVLHMLDVYSIFFEVLYGPFIFSSNFFSSSNAFPLSLKTTFDNDLCRSSYQIDEVPNDYDCAAIIYQNPLLTS